MSKKIKRQLIILICLIALIITGIAMMPFYHEYNLKQGEREQRKRTLNWVADSMENVLNQTLQTYKKNEKMIAIADTDEKMQAYKSLDEILNVATGLDVENVEDYFETWIKANIHEKYYPLIEDEKNEGYKFWVLIKENHNEGFIAEVKYAKNDPFKKKRLHDK